MSLYNMVCGVNPGAGMLLALIELDPSTIPRFRDVWINPEFTQITVHTRTGGGNRAEYEAQNALLTTHHNYLHNADDSFDNTFADFVFRVTAIAQCKLQNELDKIFDSKRKAKVIAILTKQPRQKLEEAMVKLQE